MRTTLSIDEQTRQAMQELPRPFKSSALLRWLLKALTTDNKEWDRLIKNDPEIKAVQDYVRPRLRRVLQLDEKS